MYYIEFPSTTEVTKQKSIVNFNATFGSQNVSPTWRSGGVTTPTTRQAELRWEQKQAPQSEVRLAAPFAPHPSLPVARRLRTLSRQTFLESGASSLDALVAAVSVRRRRRCTRSLVDSTRCSNTHRCLSVPPSLPSQSKDSRIRTQPVVSPIARIRVRHVCVHDVAVRTGGAIEISPRRFNSPRDPAARRLRTLSRQTPLSKVVCHP